MVLRVVDTTPPAPPTMAEAIEAACARCTAANPVAVLLTYEADGKMTTISIPESVMVQKGFTLVLHEQLFGKPTIEEE